MKECLCDGNISKCDHSLHGESWTTGWIDMPSGEQITNHDPAICCSGCGIPLRSVKEKQ